MDQFLALPKEHIAATHIKKYIEKYSNKKIYVMPSKVVRHEPLSRDMNKLIANPFTGEAILQIQPLLYISRRSSQYVK